MNPREPLASKRQKMLDGLIFLGITGILNYLNIGMIKETIFHKFQRILNLCLQKLRIKLKMLFLILINLRAFYNQVSQILLAN